MKLFQKVMEIRSRAGVLHFKRWAIIECKWFNIYIHYIGHSDMDKHPHNHPWEFTTFILKGGYVSKNYFPFPLITNSVIKYTQECLPLDRVKGSIDIYHKIRLIRPTYTLVFTGPRINNDWGYLVDGKHIDAEEYRRRKYQ